MNIAEELDEIVICVDKPCLVSTLEKVSGGAKLFVSIARVVCGDPLHHLSERVDTNLDQSMHVMVHPTIGVQSRLVLC